jgi:peptide deformylase
MALLEIRRFPDPVLRKDCVDAQPGTDTLRQLAADMLETMYAAPGIGLAAPQVGENIRMVTVDINGHAGDPDPHVLLNPVIESREGEIAFEEGCLSVPELMVEIDRSQKICVAYQDLEGTSRELEAEDLLAVAIQHEMDHLEGRLILDYASAVKRDLYKRKVRKMMAASES